jgi:hypothetical protein
MPTSNSLFAALSALGLLVYPQVTPGGDVNIIDEQYGARTGSFESDLPWGRLPKGSIGIGGWVCATTNYQNWNSTWFDKGYASDGSCSLLITSDNAPVTLRITLTVVPGATYQLSFDVANSWWTGGTAQPTVSFSVFANTAQIGRYTLAAPAAEGAVTPWQTFIKDFVADGSTVVLKFTMDPTAPSPDLFFDKVVVSKLAPSIACSRSTLDFGDSLTELNFDVWNAGIGILNYQISDLPAWVATVNPSSGSSASSSDRHTHTVTIDRSKLAPGPNTATLTITSAQASDSPQTIQLQAVVVPPTGSLRVIINPADAVAAGARWKRVGAPTWFESGETETGIPVGQSTLEFKPLLGWVSPSSTMVHIDDGITTHAWGDYTLRAISGKIAFRTRLGAAPSEIQFPSRVTVTIWQDISPDCQWPGLPVWTYDVLNTQASSEFDYLVPIPFFPDGTNTIGFSVFGADQKMFRIEIKNGIAQNANVVLTYEDVASATLVAYLCRKTGDMISFGFSPDEWTGAETQAVMRALSTWQGTGLMQFHETRLPVPWCDIYFVKGLTTGARPVPFGPKPHRPFWFVEFSRNVQWTTDSRLTYGAPDPRCWTGISRNPPAWPLESAALHEIGHVLGLRYPTGDSPEDWNEDSARGQWSIMAYNACELTYSTVWPGWSDLYALEGINDALKLAVTCPVDLVVTDPNGLTTTRTNAGIPSSQYYESDGEGGTNHIAVVLIEKPAGTNYQVTVVPRPEAQEADTFSLSVQSGNGEVPIAIELPIAANPANGFSLYAQPGLVQYDHCVFSVPLDLGEVWVLKGTPLPISFSLSNCTNSPIAEFRDLVMEIAGPDADGIFFTNSYSLTNGTLLFQSSASPPSYSALFDTLTNSLKLDEQYFLAVKQYGAPIGTATLIISTKRDSRVNIRDYRLTPDGNMTLRWDDFPGQVFVESSTNLTVWYTTAGPLSTNFWTSSSLVSDPSRFYRLRGTAP